MFFFRERSVNESAAQHVIALGGLHRGEEQIQAEGKDLESWTNRVHQVCGGEWEKGDGLACVMYAQDLSKLLAALAADSNMFSMPWAAKISSGKDTPGPPRRLTWQFRGPRGMGLSKVCFGVFDGFQYHK